MTLKSVLRRAIGRRPLVCHAKKMFLMRNTQHRATRKPVFMLCGALQCAFCSLICITSSFQAHETYLRLIKEQALQLEKEKLAEEYMLKFEKLKDRVLRGKIPPPHIETKSVMLNLSTQIRSVLLERTVSICQA